MIRKIAPEELGISTGSFGNDETVDLEVISFVLLKKKV